MYMNVRIRTCMYMLILYFHHLMPSCRSMSQLSWNKPDKGSAAIITSLLMVLVRCCAEPHRSEYKPGGCGFIMVVGGDIGLYFF